MSRENSNLGKVGVSGGGAFVLLALVKILFGRDLADVIVAWALILLGIALAAALTREFIQSWQQCAPVSGGPRWGLLFGGWASGSVIAAVGLGFLLWPDLRSPEEKAADILQRCKAEITRDESVPEKPIVKVSFRDSKFGFHGLRDADLDELRLHLESLRDLRELDLVRTDITDRGLQHLKGLTQLKTIQLGSTWGAHPGLTRGGVEALRKALPHTAVYFYEPLFMPGPEMLKQFGKP